MAHGTPDWGVTASKKTIYSLHDMGELAVRLGAIHVHDRRGDVIFQDQFDGGESRVSAIGAGLGNEVYLSCNAPLAGTMNLMFHTGPDIGDHSGIMKVVPYLVLGGIGLECSFIPVDNLSIIHFTLLVFDGADKHHYEIEYDHVAGTVLVKDTGGVPKIVGTPGVLRAGYTIYSTLKAVVDTEKGKYVRVILNDQTYLAGDWKPTVTADLLTRPSLTTEVYAVTAVDAAIDVPADRLIITQNEPI